MTENARQRRTLARRAQIAHPWIALHIGLNRTPAKRPLRTAALKRIYRSERQELCELVERDAAFVEQ